MSNHPAPSVGQRFKPARSTYVVGSIAILFLAIGAASSGIAGLVIMAALLAFGTGLYVAITGRKSWAMLPGGRKIGACVLAGSVVLLLVGGALAPKPASDLDAEAASKNGNPATSASPSASQTASATPTPVPTDTGTPLDPESVVVLAAGAEYKAPGSQPAYATKAIDLLSTLAIKGRAPKTGYDRAMFGQSWADVDRNGCDTRNDILKRDLTEISYTNSVPCKVQSGVLADPYTGTSIKFLRGSTTSTAVQIDHVVALSDAWQKGAQQLSLEQRTAFANDPLNLQATDGPTNQKKGDGDAATWLPPNNGYRCEYVARQISVKATYKLWVTQAEYDAMARILANCSGQLAPTNEKAPEPAPAAPAPVAPAPVAPAPAAPAPAAPAPVAPAPAPVPAAVVPAPAPAAPYYANCTAVRNAGAAPIHISQPGYGKHLDRDGDGWGCDK